MAKPIIVETRHGRAASRGITYQRELVLCGKARCKKRHGPYWYAYWKYGNRLRKRYLGKVLRQLAIDDVISAETRPRAAEDLRAGPVLGNREDLGRARAGLPKTGRRRTAAATAARYVFVYAGRRWHIRRDAKYAVCGGQLPSKGSAPTAPSTRASMAWARVCQSCDRMKDAGTR